MISLQDSPPTINTKKLTSSSWQITVSDGECEAVFSDTGNIANAKKREDIAKRIIDAAPGCDIDGIKRMLLDAAAKDDAPTTDAQAKKETPGPVEISREELGKTSDEEKREAEDFLKAPDLIERILKDVEAIGLVGEQENALALYLVNTSRLLTAPLAAILFGQSSSGKSYTINAIARLFPDESILKAHSLTPEALTYLHKNALVHRGVISGERSRDTNDEASDKTKNLREMISDGELVKVVPVRNECGEYETQEIRRKGPISFIESTTLAAGAVFDEDLNRCLRLYADESREQTERIIKAQAERDRQGPQADREAIFKKHHTAQRMLDPLDVVLPFDYDSSFFPTERVEARRAWNHFTGLIKAVALLHQKQRKRNDRGAVIADVVDAETVERWFKSVIARGLEKELPQSEKMLLEKLAEEYPQGTAFTARNVMDLTKMKKDTVYARMRSLRDQGYIRQEENTGGGRKAKKYSLTGGPDDDGFFSLPTVKLAN